MQKAEPSGSAIQIAGLTIDQDKNETRQETAESFEHIASTIPGVTGFIGLGAMGQGMAKGM